MLVPLHVFVSTADYAALPDENVILLDNSGYGFVRRTIYVNPDDVSHIAPRRAAHRFDFKHGCELCMRSNGAIYLCLASAEEVASALSPPDISDE